MKQKGSPRARKRGHRETRMRAQRSARPQMAVESPARPASAEREIKFEVPEPTWAALLEHFSAHEDAQEIELQANYVDTPARELARAAIGVRMRREGDQWIQTVKAPGSHAFERLEDEVYVGPVKADVQAPATDLSRHTSDAVQKALRSALGVASEAALPSLQTVFEVNVRRRTRRVKQGSSTIELSLDDGRISAGSRSLPVRELELELVEGQLEDLLTVSRLWRERWGLWISTASKAARGDRLVADMRHGPPTTAAGPQLPAKPTMGEFTAAVIHACMEQVLGNASEIAAGSQSDGHVHQLRVGLRRLRTAMRELPTLASERKRFEPVLVKVFRGLGERRDRTHVLHTIQPLVEQAGGSPVKMPDSFEQGADPVDLVRRDEFQDALLGLLAAAERIRTMPGESPKRTVRAHLTKLHKQIIRDGGQFTKLSEDEQHQVRKRLKRLRYLSEFVSPLYARDAVRHYLNEIKPAQEALGDYNDKVMAQELYEELAQGDSAAKFGVEWLKDIRPSEAKSCRKLLRRLKSSRPFWKKP